MSYRISGTNHNAIRGTFRGALPIRRCKNWTGLYNGVCNKTGQKYEDIDWWKVCEILSVSGQDFKRKSSCPNFE